MVAGVEFSDLNWIGLAAAVVFAMILGFIWYSPKTPMGKVWMRGQGMDPNNVPKPPMGKMMLGLVIMLVGSFLTWFVIAHTMVAYHDSYKLDCTGVDEPKGCDGEGEWDLTPMDAVYSGLFTWLGFFLPLTMGAVAWENKSWGYALNNALFYLISLMAGSMFMVFL